MLQDLLPQTPARGASEMNVRGTAATFRPDIEGLRGVAILLVVGCHCDIGWCAGRFVGVDVFFVLSGYLITGLLAAEYRATSRLDLPRFFARRARRLLPGATLALVVVTIVAAALLSPREMEFTARAARAAGLYMSNVFFDRSAADYFAPTVASNPLLHTWSLGLEEQFYLVWPLLIILSYRGLHRLRWSLAVLGALVLSSFMFCLWATRAAPTVAFYELPSRAWELAAGAVLALLPISWAARRGRWAHASGLIGMCMILGTAALLKGGSGFPGWIALFPVIGTLATLFAGAVARQCWPERRAWAKPLQVLGSQILFLVSVALAGCRVRRRVVPRDHGLWQGRSGHRCALGRRIDFPPRRAPDSREPPLRWSISGVVGGCRRRSRVERRGSWSLLAFGQGSSNKIADTS